MFFFNRIKMDAAIRNGDCARVEALLRKGVSADMVIGNDPLIKLAVLENQPHILELLIDRGAKLPPVNGYDQMTLLHIAARRGYADVADVLIKAWPEMLHARDNLLRTPLHDAARFGHADTVRDLIAAGAEPLARDLDNRTPYYRAREREHDHAAAHLKIYNRYPESPEAGWHRDGEEKIIHVVYEHQIGYKITDIFNFASAERVRICQNLETQAESSETRSFEEMEDKRVLKDAVREMKKQGATIDISRIDPFYKHKGH